MLALATISLGEAAETNVAGRLDVTNVSARALPKFEVRAYRLEGDVHRCRKQPACFLITPARWSSRASRGIGPIATVLPPVRLSEPQRYPAATGADQWHCTRGNRHSQGHRECRCARHGCHFKWCRPGSNRPGSGCKLPCSAGSAFEVRGYLRAWAIPFCRRKIRPAFQLLGRVEFARVREGLGKLQLLYRELGFATIGSPSRQKLTDGIVQVKVVEGKLDQIKVEGTRYFSTDNVRRALPSLNRNSLLNTKWFQPELDLANANPDRDLSPSSTPGSSPATAI